MNTSSGGSATGSVDHSRPRAVRGMSLIEVLVTIFVTGVGLLGVANLQVVTKKVIHEAAQRTAAAALVQDLAERMRANPDGFDAYLTDDVSGQGSASDCASQSCSGAELAAYDLNRWRRKLLGEDQVDDEGYSTGGLVSVTGCVEQDAGGVAWVVVAWRGINAAAVDPADTLAARLSCGMGLGRYDDPETAGGDERLRRFVAVPVLASSPFSG